MPTGKVMTKNSGWVNKPKLKYDYSKINPLKWIIILSFLRWYPDRMLDITSSDDADLDVAFLQRIKLRATARKQIVFDTGSRGSTKTHCAVGSQATDGTLTPGMQSKHFAPTKEQSAELVLYAIETYEKNNPMLMQEWKHNSGSKDSVKITSKEKSSIQSQATLASNRGGNLTRLVAEECGQEDKGSKPFNHTVFRQAVSPANRNDRKINKIVDEYVIPYKELYITSATSQQNEAYMYRHNALQLMKNPPNPMPNNRVGTGIVLGNSWVASVASGIRTIHWAKKELAKMLPEERLREMESVWTGTSDNPMVTDLAMTRARTLRIAELNHCEKPNVHYFIGIDTSYSNEDGNAKCAVSVVKASELKQEGKRNKLLREEVNVFDFSPPSNDREQAKIYKEVLYNYLPKTDFLNAGYTILCIDASIGNNVVAELMADMQDGLPPLSCVNHFKLDLELPNAMPCILPIRATSHGSTEQEFITLETAEITVPDILLVKQIRSEFSNGNIKLLIQDINEGISAYKKFHNIKDDINDVEISQPYKKTTEQVSQIRNLKSINGREERISAKTNRDMWSTVKLANQGITVLEKQLFRPQQNYNDIETKISGNDCYNNFKGRLVTSHGGRRY